MERSVSSRIVSPHNRIVARRDRPIKRKAQSKAFVRVATSFEHSIVPPRNTRLREQ
jgi:hypothetical protein